MSQHLVKSLLSSIADLECNHFGSSVTGLATPSSDVDIAFRVPSLQKRFDEQRHKTKRRNPLKEVSEKLEVISDAINSMEDYNTIEIVHARYPLVRAVHMASRTEFQIVCSGTETLVAEKVMGFMDEYPTLRSTFMVVKEVLASRNLHKPAYGGLSSYPLLMMIVASFKLTTIPRDDPPHASILRFFKFIVDFDTSENGISIEPLALYKKRKSVLVGSPTTKAAIKESPVRLFEVTT